MRKLTLALILAAALPAPAIDTSNCAGSLAHLAALYELRAMLLKTYTTPYDVERFAARRIEELREPLGGGDYRWVRWVRPSGGGPTEKRGHTTSAIEGRGNEDRFEAAGQHVYAVRIVAPAKRSLLKKNNPVYVSEVEITADGSTRTHRINRWMNPDTSQTFDLNGIADRVAVTAHVSTAPNNAGESLLEVHFRQAVAEDDPDNPAFSTIRMLERVREKPDAVTVDAEVAAMEREMFPAAGSLPILTLITDLRRADELMRSSKPEEKEKGEKLLQETLRRLR
jgi:hypothetical protein